MHFSHVAATFAQIKKLSKRTEITQVIAKLLDEATPKEARYITYLALGSLRAPYEEAVFGIAEKSFIKIVIEMLGISADAVHEALKLHGDIGEVIERGTWQAQQELSVTQMYQLLVTLTDIKGSGSQEERLLHITEFMRRISPQEAGCVARIILGKLRLGFSDMTIIDALSWMVAGDKSLHAKIENSYNLCADLGLIAEQIKLKDDTQLTMHIGIPIRPAAAERLEDPDAIFEKLGACVAQPKIDGFRLQVHLDYTKEHKVHFFSRNLIDMSKQFPDLIDALKGLPVQTAIFEGEAIVYDAKHHAFLPFQETVKRKRKHDIESVAAELPLTLFVFDMLYLDGVSYIDRPHHERRAALAQLLKGHSSPHLKLIEELKMDSAQVIEDYFHKAIEEGLEGIMVKRPDAPYQPGKRNFNWIKLKRTDSVGGLADTVDAVIVGYYMGRGKRAKFGIGALLVAVYQKDQDMFVTIAKIGTGLTDVEWCDIKKQCDVNAVDAQPHNLLCDVQLIPDVWVAPKLVCAVRADEITRSPLHTAGARHDQGAGTGYALRFPRFMGLRVDKSPQDATTVEEIMHLYELARKRSVARQ